MMTRYKKRSTKRQRRTQTPRVPRTRMTQYQYPRNEELHYRDFFHNQNQDTFTPNFWDCLHFCNDTGGDAGTGTARELISSVPVGSGRTERTGLSYRLQKIQFRINFRLQNITQGNQARGIEMPRIRLMLIQWNSTDGISLDQIYDKVLDTSYTPNGNVFTEIDAFRNLSQTSDFHVLYDKIKPMSVGEMVTLDGSAPRVTVQQPLVSRPVTFKKNITIPENRSKYRFAPTALANDVPQVIHHQGRALVFLYFIEDPATITAGTDWRCDGQVRTRFHPN